MTTSTSSSLPPVPDASTDGAAADTQTFRLYVSAASPVSSRAVVNVRRFLDYFLPGCHQLHVWDIAGHVESARSDQVIAAPTLIRTAPLPRRHFIGDMSDVERMRTSLGLADPRRG